MKVRSLVFSLLAFLLVAVPSMAREIRLPDEALLTGTVLIAERFVEIVGREKEEIPLEFPVWPGDRGLRPSTWFATLVEAHPGDTITISPGAYTAQIWIFTDGVTIRTDPEAEELAWIRGTVEVDADGVLLERIGVTDSGDQRDSGHGFEVHRDLVGRVTFRSCRAEGNRWTGIHIVGSTGSIQELRVEDCVLVDNGIDGMDASLTLSLIVIGCTITGNGWDQANGVGVRIGHSVGQIELSGNTIESNRSANVYYAE